MSTELTHIAALFNPLVQKEVSSILDDFPWSSELAQTLSETIKGGNVDLSDEAIKHLLVDKLVDNEIKVLIESIHKYKDITSKEDIKIIAQSIFEYYQTQRIQSILNDYQSNPDIGIFLNHMREVPTELSSEFEIKTLGGLNPREVFEREIGGTDNVLPSTIRIVREATPFNGYLPGQVVMVVAPPGCMTGDTVVPLLDGTEMTLEELYKSGRENIGVYSSDQNGNVKASVAKKCVLTKYVNRLVHIELDDGTILKVTEEHPMLLIDGQFKRADQLASGDSLMNMSKDICYAKGYGKYNWHVGYEMTKNSFGQAVPTHYLTAEYLKVKKPELFEEDNLVIHHNCVKIDDKGQKYFDKLNNDPEYIIPMGRSDHNNLHRKFILENGPEDKRQAILNHLSQNGQITWDKALQYKKNHGKLPDHYVQPCQHLSVETEFTSEYISARNTKNWQCQEYREKMLDVLKTNGKKTASQFNSIDSNLNGQRSKCFGVMKYVNHLIKNKVITSFHELTEYIYNSNRVDSDGNYVISPRTPKWSSALKYYNNDIQKMFMDGLTYSNHTIKSVKIVDYDHPIPVYDLLEVDLYSCYAVKCKDGSYVFSHNTGKSAFIMQEVANMAIGGSKVLMLILGDLMEYDIITRFVALVSNTKYYEVAINPDKYFTDEIKEVANNIDFVVTPAKSLSSTMILELLNNSKKRYDVVVVDYDSNVKTTSESMYEAGGELYDILTSVTRPKDQPYRLVFVACQPNKMYWDYEELPEESAGESSRKQHNVDLMITIGRAKSNNEKTKIGRIAIPKVRRGNAGASMPYRVTESGEFIEIEESVYKRSKSYSA